MIPERASVVVCGAGMAGLSAAWHLAVRHGIRDVVVVDERAPLTLTSDKSTECYRNWWPDTAMLGLMNRSIEILDELARRSGNAFALNRNGYLYLTGSVEGAAALADGAERIAALGAGELRIHPGRSPASYRAPDWDRPEATADGADLFLDGARIREVFPWAAADCRAALHARRCGWLSAQQLGMLWLEEARAAGVRLIEGRVVAVEAEAGAVAAVGIAAADRVHRLRCGVFVNAAGPYVDEVARLVGVGLPVFHELHRKVFFEDTRGVVPRHAPLAIWNDPVRLELGDDERQALAEEPATAFLLGEIPAGVHFRPEGGAESRAAILLWNYHCDPVARVYPIPEDPLHAPVVVRGIARLLPAFAAYAETGPRQYVDGGYYTKTRENRPLIGPLGPRGGYLIGALSGFGVMASAAAGELLAAHVTGAPLPGWAPAFRLERYENADYLRTLASAEQGQL